MSTHAALKAGSSWIADRRSSTRERIGVFEIPRNGKDLSSRYRCILKPGKLLLISLGLHVAAVERASADPVTVQVGGLQRVVYQNSYALLIGESDYRVWQPLRNVPSDLSAVHDALVTNGFLPENIKMAQNVASVDFIPLLNDFVASHAGEMNRLFIYYAGHGASDTTRDIGYLVPVDAPEQTDANFRSKAVPLPVVKALISLSGAKHTLVVFDSCFSGSIFMTRGNIHPKPFSAVELEAFSKPRVQIITSGDSDQQVPADSEFANALVAALTGAAQNNGRSVLTADELGVWLSSHVTQTTVRIGSAGRESGGQFMFPFAPLVTPPARQADAINPVASAPAVRSTARSAAPELNSAIRRDRPFSRLSEADLTSQTKAGEITVHYYKKSRDGLSVLRALDALGVTYVAEPPQIGDRFTINALACSSEADFSKVKPIALGLIRGGVPLRMIYQFRRGNPKRKVVELVTYRQTEREALSTPVLTEADVSALSRCPTFLWKGQPRPGALPPTS